MKNFITIEGCDGVGKTYQTTRLKEYCNSTNQNVVFTREPGGSKVAEKIRDIILDAHNTTMSDVCEAFLYASARAQHLHDVVEPALKDGKIVFCDRFVDSSYVYQGLGRGLGVEWVQRLNELAVGEFMPDYTIFLELSPEKAFERKGGCDKNDRMENNDMVFYKKVYEGYHLLINRYPNRFIVIDASGSRNETQQKILNALRKIGVIK